MNVELLAGSCVTGRNDVRLSIQDKTNVTEKGFVQNCVNLDWIIRRTLREALYLSSLSGRIHDSPSVNVGESESVTWLGLHNAIRGLRPSGAENLSRRSVCR
jgi:hypothetical protein